jgi:hypothetical protein
VVCGSRSIDTSIFPEADGEHPTVGTIQDDDLMIIPGEDPTTYREEDPSTPPLEEDHSIPFLEEDHLIPPLEEDHLTHQEEEHTIPRFTIIAGPVQERSWA